MGDARRRKLGFVEAVAPHPKTQTEWNRRVRSIRFSDALAVVTWLNATRGKPAYRRVLSIRQELMELSAALVELKGWRGKVKEGTLEEAAHLAKRSEQFRHRHNALNSLLIRYGHIPAFAYSLDSGEWRFGMVPNHRRGPEVIIEDQFLSVRVNESTVIAALCRLAANRELYKARLCDQCGKQWRVSEREMDRFCSDKCREAHHAMSNEYKERKARKRRESRDRVRQAILNGASLR